jgi:hypothetical protein
LIFDIWTTASSYLNNNIADIMGALLSIPLLAVPSMGTVSIPFTVDFGMALTQSTGHRLRG